MVEIQPCHYYEGFSQYFAYYVVDQNPNKSNSKETTLFNLI